MDDNIITTVAVVVDKCQVGLYVKSTAWIRTNEWTNTLITCNVQYYIALNSNFIVEMNRIAWY